MTKNSLPGSENAENRDDAKDGKDAKDTIMPFSLGSLKEELEEIKGWLVTKKDENSTIDSSVFAEECAELGLDVHRTITILLKDGQIFGVPQIGGGE